MIHGAYILARYSTDRQNEDTIEVQVERCSAWCQEHDLPVLDIFADMAVSGMKDTRPQYARMLRELEQGGADTVVIYDQSRMFRKMTAWFEFRDRMESMQVRVVSVTQPAVGGDLRDPSNFLIEGSMALFNQMWVLQTRQKVTEKMRYMARNGQHTGGVPPLGYEVEDGVLAVNEDEAGIVRLIFEMYAGGATYGDILHQLDIKELRTRAGNPFGRNSLHDILRNERYIGTIVYGKTQKRADGKRNTHGLPSKDCIRVEGGCPAIVSRETWDEVQRRMDANKQATKGGRPATRPQPLKGKVFCGECKAAMTISYSGHGKNYSYYDCTRKHRQGTCNNSPIRAEVLERTVAQAVREMFQGSVNKGALESVVRRCRDETMGTAGSKMSDLTAELKSINTKLNRATDAILNGVNSETLLKKVQRLEADKARVQRQMQNLKVSIDHADLSDAELEYLLNLLLQAAEKDDGAVLSLVVRVEVSKDEIKIWTLIDDPNWTDGEENASSKKLTSKTIADAIPIDTDSAYLSELVTGTTRYAEGTIIIAFRIPRPNTKF